MDVLDSYITQKFEEFSYYIFKNFENLDNEFGYREADSGNVFFKCNNCCQFSMTN